MHFSGAIVAGSPHVSNEDWFAVTPDLMVILDGATIRTETGCTHGATWYTRNLGAAIIAGAASRTAPLREVLAGAISAVANLHADCDLSHPGTPSAGVALVRAEGAMLKWLVLGDVTIVLDTTEGFEVVSDQRISATAEGERREADRHPIGSTEKAAALLAMKHAELAARNRVGGYWIAAAEPTAVDHAVTGEVAAGDVRRFALVTDGAARAVDMFARYGSWRGALDALEAHGPHSFIRWVREAEAEDPLAVRYSRNKASDDATVILVSLVTSEVARAAENKQRGLLPFEERLVLANNLLRVTIGAYGDGMAQRVAAERAAEQAE